MATALYRLTADVTVPAGVVSGTSEGSATVAGTATAQASAPWPVTFRKGDLVLLDPAGDEYSQIGGANLMQVSEAAESGGSPGEDWTGN